MDNMTAASTITSYCYISGSTGCIFNLKAVLEALSDALSEQYAVEVVSLNAESKTEISRT